MTQSNRRAFALASVILMSTACGAAPAEETLVTGQGNVDTTVPSPSEESLPLDKVLGISENAIERELERLKESAPQQQEAYFADGVISRSEYSEAISASFTCFEEASLSDLRSRPVDLVLNPPVPNSAGYLEWSYRIGSRDATALDRSLARLDMIDSRCRETFSAITEEAFMLSQLPLGTERVRAIEEFEVCIAAEGVSLPDGFLEGRSPSPNDQELKALQSCSELHPELFTVPRLSGS